MEKLLDNSTHIQPNRISSPELSNLDTDHFDGPATRAGTPQEIQPTTPISSPTKVTKTPSIKERIVQIKEIRKSKRKELAKNYTKFTETRHTDPVFQKARDALLKALTEHSPDAIKYIEKSQGINGVRLLLEQKDNDRVQALTVLKHEIETKAHGESDEELAVVSNLLKSAQEIVESTQRIHADQQSRQIINHRKYQKQVAELRTLITQKAPTKEIRTRIEALEDYDKKLRQDYEGLEPYPAQFGRFQRSVDSAMSWFVDTDMRPGPEDLLIEYSLASNGLERTTDSYRATFDQLWNTDLQTFKNRASTALGDIWEFINKHPVLASKMASQIAYMAIYMSGDPSMGALVQKAIAKKRYQYRAMDLLLGKGHSHAYAPEFENPLTPSQIALFDFLSKAPYLTAVVQGARGETWGGKIGAATGKVLGLVTSFFGGSPAAVTAGDYIGGILGGIAGAVGEVIAQKVLAESLDRDLEVWASALSFSLSEANISNVGTSLQALKEEFGLNQETMNNLLATAVSTFTFMKPGFRAFTQRGQAEKMYETLKDFESKGLLQAIQGSAQRSYSADVSAELVPEIAAPGLAAINLFKCLKAFRLIPETIFDSWIKEDLGSFYTFYDKLKLLDARPGHALQGLKGTLNQFLDIETMAYLDKNKNILAKIPAQMVQTIREGTEEAGFTALHLSLGL